MQRTITYSLTKSKGAVDHEGCRITTITIKSTDGIDESYAAKRADAKGSNMTEELIRYSLVSYTRVKDKVDETVIASQPFEGFDKWSTKARNFVVAAWKVISTPDEDELKDFFESASETE